MELSFQVQKAWLDGTVKTSKDIIDCESAVIAFICNLNCDMKTILLVYHWTHRYYNAALAWIYCISQDQLAVKTVPGSGVLVRINF